jgi:peptidoglycan/xylan/chitin deacetylase (PgdA/CDA1 family)
MVILTIPKRTAGLIAVIILAFIVLGITSYTMAKHPNMDNWKKERILIDKVETDKKVVALTFDDGPHPQFTPALLDVLKQHDARATFFVMGNKAEDHPQILKRMAMEGHEIGNHSYSHPDFNKLKKEAQLEEINKTTAIIEKHSGQNVTLLRPPGGYLSYDLIEMSKKERLIIAYWTYQQDSKDWRNGTKASVIAKHIIKNIQPGQVIILHDGCPNGMATVNAVDTILTRLEKEDYTFVTMSELIKIGK